MAQIVILNLFIVNTAYDEICPTTVGPIRFIKNLLLKIKLLNLYVYCRMILATEQLFYYCVNKKITI